MPGAVVIVVHNRRKIVFGRRLILRLDAIPLIMISKTQSSLAVPMCLDPGIRREEPDPFSNAMHLITSFVYCPIFGKKLSSLGAV